MYKIFKRAPCFILFVVLCKEIYMHMAKVLLVPLLLVPIKIFLLKVHPPNFIHYLNMLGPVGVSRMTSVFISIAATRIIAKENTFVSNAGSSFLSRIYGTSFLYKEGLWCPSLSTLINFRVKYSSIKSPLHQLRAGWK